MTFFEAIGFNPLILSAILAGFAASIVSGVMGSYVVVKRISFISGSISHAVLGGIGLSLWLKKGWGFASVSPIAGALLAAVLSAVIIGWIHLRYKQREDSVIATLWSIGMSLGVIFIALTPGSASDLSDYLVGNLLFVSDSDLKTLWALDLVVLCIVIPLHKRLLLICFDEDEARLRGLPVDALYLLLLILVSLSVVLLVEVVGIILVMTMLTLPATIANLFFHRLSSVMIAAVALSALFTLVGSFAAYHLDWPLGATIALVAGSAYVVGLFFRRK